MSQPAILEIVRKDESRYHYSLTLPGNQPQFLAGTKLWAVDVDPKLIQTLSDGVSEAVLSTYQEGAQPEAYQEIFSRLGGGLFDALLPKRQAEGLRRELRNLDSPLLIITDAPDVFWEHMHDSEQEQPFCLRFPLGRSLRTTDVPRGVPPKERQQWRCLIIANATSDLPDAADEAAVLRRSLEGKGIDCSVFLEGAECTYSRVVAALLTEYDIIHYAGHVEMNDQREFCMVLHGGEFLTPGNIRTLGKGAPIVFLNGCQSGGAVSGLGDAFIAAGARVVVGSLFESPDAGGRAFAEAFYEAALKGKSMGEAMLLARQHVLGKSEYAAAWACYIMYGDPTLRFQLKTDHLQTCLQSLGLTRLDLDPGAERILEDAVGYGQPVGEMGSAHLFAALVDGPSRIMWHRLQELGIPPAQLSKAFQQVFRVTQQGRESEPIDGQSASVRLSHSAERILRAAREAVPEERIRETDLVRGFVQCGGGNTGEILRRLGVSLPDLDPGKSVPRSRVRRDSEAAAPLQVRSVGGLTERDCEALAWNILLVAVSNAFATKSTRVGTPHLLAGLAHRQDGLLSASLRRFRIQLSLQVPPQESSTPVAGDVGCSATVERILLEARALAAIDSRDRLAERDLLRAFVRLGGGTSGERLARQGLVLQALTSGLFEDSGDLALERFDGSLQDTLSEALGTAKRKRYSVLGRRHLVLAMLCRPESYLSVRIREQEKDVELLADQLLALMPTGSSTQGPPGLKTRSLSSELVSVLCRAEELCSEQREEKISESHVIRAWLEDGGGELGAWLAERGVRLRRLV